MSHHVHPNGRIYTIDDDSEELTDESIDHDPIDVDFNNYVIRNNKSRNETGISLVHNMVKTVKKTFPSTKVIDTKAKPTDIPILIPTMNQSKPAAQSWNNPKQIYKNMDVVNKRKEYPFGKEYMVLEQVKSWSEFCNDYKLRLDIKMTAPIPMFQDFSLDCCLNKVLSEKVAIFFGDITTLEIDAIVCATDYNLSGNGGVDRAIHVAAGHFFNLECAEFRGCDTGTCRITGGYKLPARNVIHTVGPRSQIPALLRSCYTESMNTMLQNNLETIAFPCIASGCFKYPIISSAHVAVSEIRKQLELHHDKIRMVIFCVYGQEEYKIYQGMLQSYFPVV